MAAGPKCGEIPLNADRNRCAPPAERKPFIGCSRCRVGWWEFCSTSSLVSSLNSRNAVPAKDSPGSMCPPLGTVRMSQRASCLTGPQVEALERSTANHPAAVSERGGKRCLFVTFEAGRLMGYRRDTSQRAVSWPQSAGGCDRPEQLVPAGRGQGAGRERGRRAHPTLPYPRPRARPVGGPAPRHRPQDQERSGGSPPPRPGRRTAPGGRSTSVPPSWPPLATRLLLPPHGDPVAGFVLRAVVLPEGTAAVPYCPVKPWRALVLVLSRLAVRMAGLGRRGRGLRRGPGSRGVPDRPS